MESMRGLFSWLTCCFQPVCGGTHFLGEIMLTASRFGDKGVNGCNLDIAHPLEFDGTCGRLLENICFLSMEEMISAKCSGFLVDFCLFSVEANVLICICILYLHMYIYFYVYHHDIANIYV